METPEKHGKATEKHGKKTENRKFPEKLKNPGKNMGIPEIRRRWQKNAEILEFRQKPEKTGNRGNGKTADSRKPGAPSPAPLSGPPYY